VSIFAENSSLFRFQIKKFCSCRKSVLFKTGVNTFCANSIEDAVIVSRIRLPGNCLFCAGSYVSTGIPVVRAEVAEGEKKLNQPVLISITRKKVSSLLYEHEVRGLLFSESLSVQ
jgi:hypothetical protein